METPIEVLLNKIEFKETARVMGDSGLPYVTHEGVLQLGAISITVYMLNTGQRIIPESEIIKFLGQL